MGGYALAFTLFSLPFAIERFYFKERLGGFTVLFYLSSISLFLLISIDWIAGNYSLYISVSIIERLFIFVGGASYIVLLLCLNLTVVCAISWIMVKIGEWLFSETEKE